MTKEQQIETADRIAAEHGCVIQPGANGRPSLGLMPQHQGQGGDLDLQATRRCLEAIQRAGIDTSHWTIGPA